MAVEDKMIDIIVEQLSVDREKVVPGASFVDDLGADSLDLVELIMAMEEEFDVKLSQSSIGRCLHAMLFCYRKKKYNPLVNTQDYIVEWRKRYIETITKLRAQNCIDAR